MSTTLREHEQASKRVKITPVIEQYLRNKEEFPDALLFFRLGDFYELFFEDAERAARLLDLTLTTRSKKDEIPIPMCGVPHHAVQSYVAKLLHLGLKVALCDQMEDPAQAKGIVARQVVRVLTPGTLTEEEYLDPKQPNYLAAVSLNASSSLAYADLSTGELCQKGLGSRADLLEALTRLGPREVLLRSDEEVLAEEIRSKIAGVVISVIPPDTFDSELGKAWLNGGEREVREGAGLSSSPALGALLWYLRRTHRGSLSHLRLPEMGEEPSTMVLDETTRRNLELLATTRGERKGSLLWVLDQTATPMGGRLLRQWLLAPSTDPVSIGHRLDAVEELQRQSSWREDIIKKLGGIGDLERLTARLTSARVTPRDLLGLGSALEAVGSIRTLLSQAHAQFIGQADSGMDPLPDVRERIATTLADDPPANPRAGNVIRPGFDARIDELRDLAHHGRRTIGELEAAERARTGISSLKVRYNQVFGYYIEVTRPNLHLVPEHFRRKQTLANAERFITPELEEYEAKVLGAEERLSALEGELFEQLVIEIAARHASLSATAASLARLDVVACLARVAERNRYTRPSLSREREIFIEEGRHPVVELMAGRHGFVSNDCRIEPDEQQILILTGPNMAGKSTYLRQVAMITLMAQMGSFVPAAQARIGIVDRLFTRIGASDNLAAGESTFMVEMKETARILNELTPRSLVILDEIGRGTSTFDGISIAWAVTEHLHDGTDLRPLVLFATHYHELTDLARTKPRVRNFSVAVREWKGEVVFLRRVVAGPASQSYGIQVAQLAGVPDGIINRAREILQNLESGELTEAGLPRIAIEKTNRARPEQLPLFETTERRLRAELSGMDLERMTPLEALNRLHELREAARKPEK